jgi:catechol 2,3-dioxygenase-like lactoylglutathione lyase family enzyme
MFSHVTVGCSDLEAAGHFYDAVLTPLGLVRRPVEPDGGPASVCWVMSGTTLPRFYAYHPYDGRRCSVGNGGMVAFAARDEIAVDQAYRAGLQLGGTDEGAPGVRKAYGNGTVYYGAYLRDPDGNKVHIVFRGGIAEAINRK